MRIKARARTLAARALAESMEVKTMVHVARRLFGNYDLSERTGFPRSVPIPNKTAARQIVDDAADNDMFLEFVTLLLDIQRLGMEGRKYRFPRLQLIVNEILEIGYRYDAGSKSFVEDSDIRTTRNWGVLREGDTYIMAFLGVDVVGNSRLVRAHGKDLMGRIYGRLRELVTMIVERRNGRLWGWEGDGGIAAFTFEEQNERASLCAIELMNEVFLYNLTSCPLEEGIHIRAVVHNGPCEYSESGSELKVDTIKRIWEIDGSLGKADTLILTDSVYPSLERDVASAFSRLQVDNDQDFHTYAVRFAD